MPKNSPFFTKIEDGHVIVSKAGVHKQVPLYERRGRVYAKHGSGFVALARDNVTSIPAIRIEELIWPEELNPPQYSNIGRMYMPGAVPKGK